VEVKSVTLKRDGRALFPDAITERGQKHLRELMEIKQKGLRAAMLFVIQREDVDIFSPAISIDSTYAELLSLAYKNGVEIFAYRCKMGLEVLSLEKSLPIELC
jgi:sugar fermentation stimulation protein A